MKILGLIAGMGEIPKAVAKNAKEQGYKVSAIGIDPIVDTSLQNFVDFMKVLHVGKIGAIIKTLKEQGVSEAVLAGKFPKTMLFSKMVMPDLRTTLLLTKIKDWGDDSIINAVSEEFEKDGIRFLGITEFCRDSVTPEGVLTKTPPSEKEWFDIKFGFGIAKEIGRLDIGQTVVVKGKAVIAVEAIEGTDEAIKRGGLLAGDGAVVVKVIRPNQDIRFDVPVVGMNTLRAMMEVNIRVLAVEAHKSIFLERELFIKEAEANNISVVGYSA